MPQSFSLEPGWRVALRHLVERERELERRCRHAEERYSGLVELEPRLRLVQTRLAVALVLLDAAADSADEPTRRQLRHAASRRARSAYSDLEELRALNISEDQRHLLHEDPDYLEAVKMLEQLVLEGGAGLIRPDERDGERERAIRDAVVDAVEKYAEPDDRYEPIMGRREPRRALPRGLHRLFRLLFPTFVEHGPRELGIGEEEERLVVSERMRMPLSQAILYTRDELMPRLRKLLDEHPGDEEAQERLRELELQLERFMKLKFIPRSTPVVLEKGFYTEWYAGYTPEGELLVNVALPVTFRSGTNVSRMQGLVLGELARRLAGRGICRELDEQYGSLRSLKSGTRGSSRFPSLRLDTARGFAALKREFPHLGALEGREEFSRLLEAARRGGRKALQSGVRRLLRDASRRLDTAFLSDETSAIL